MTPMIWRHWHQTIYATQSTASFATRLVWKAISICQETLETSTIHCWSFLDTLDKGIPSTHAGTSIVVLYQTQLYSRRPCHSCWFYSTTWIMAHGQSHWNEAWLERSSSQCTSPDKDQSTWEAYKQNMSAGGGPASRYQLGQHELTLVKTLHPYW